MCDDISICDPVIVDSEEFLQQMREEHGESDDSECDVTDEEVEEIYEQLSEGDEFLDSDDIE
ncbi:hypothetical protein [Halopiger thermotolerans]